MEGWQCCCLPVSQSRMWRGSFSRLWTGPARLPWSRDPTFQGQRCSVWAPCVTTRGCSWHLVGRGSGCCQPCSAQNHASPQGSCGEAHPGALARSGPPQGELGDSRSSTRAVSICEEPIRPSAHAVKLLLWLLRSGTFAGLHPRCPASCACSSCTLGKAGTLRTQSCSAATGQVRSTGVKTGLGKGDFCTEMRRRRTGLWSFCTRGGREQEGTHCAMLEVRRHLSGEPESREVHRNTIGSWASST